MFKQRIVVVCPGRGTYTRETIGYLKTYGESAKDQINWIDGQRESIDLLTLTDLDNQPFKTKIHMAGEHASPLIYACSLSDFLSIDQSKFEIVAITGNSMGWYIALALCGAVSYKNAYHLIQTMGSMMIDGITGGQIIYPIMDEHFHLDPEKSSIAMAEIEKAGAYVSIYLGGYLVIGGDQKVLDILLKKLPQEDKYPFQLPYHGAFHTPLMKNISAKVLSTLEPSLFQKPVIPMVDGRGYIWSPYSTDIFELHQYTLGHQVTKSYDFSSAITIAMKEFCPDKLVLLGPGNTLGGVVAQIMIQNKWQDIDSKFVFRKKQKKDPYLISMGIEEQRKLICT
ncbi:MAG: acyl carrier protein [Candidatus Marinimicrobia bacterium]|nr:acyl carrier protein [Candidatus Neomarinimicrobiota bacterium]